MISGFPQELIPCQGRAKGNKVVSLPRISKPARQIIRIAYMETRITLVRNLPLVPTPELLNQNVPGKDPEYGFFNQVVYRVRMLRGTGFA